MRKSAQQRITDTQAAIALWETAGLKADRRTAFMRDALLRLQRGKGLSTKQREWLDTLCAEGPPAPKGDPKLLARIDAAMQHVDARGKEALTSMRGTITRGYKLSEKQEGFLNALLEGAEKVAKNGHWQPGAELKRKADFACAVLSTRSTTWQGTHPGTMSAVNRYKAWQGDPTAHHIDEYVVTKVMSACAPAMREYDKPKFAEGELVWLTDGYWIQGGQPHQQGVLPRGSMALVTGGPEAVMGDVGYPVLVGAVPLVLNGKILTRNPAKAKVG